MKTIYLYLTLGLLMSTSALSAEVDLDKKWLGVWKYVENIEKVLPEEVGFRTVNVYDNLEITNVTKAGFQYRNAGNDVGYGPNEQTYSEGYAVFTDEGNAEDKESGLRIDYYQAKKMWDRGLTVTHKTDHEKKYFKKVRTTFEAGFNCDKAGTHIEKRICAVALLARADNEVGQYYRKLRKTLSRPEKKEVRSSQRAWLKKRNKMCQDKRSANDQCLSALYAERLLLLRKMTDLNIGQTTSLLDVDYMKAVYSHSPRLWDNTVLRLVFNSHQQDEFSRKLMTYQPEIKGVVSDTEAVFTGKFEYSTIIWPADVIVQVSFQLVVNDKGQLWFSTSTKSEGDVDVKIHFGSDKKPKSVVDWSGLR